VKTWIAIAAAFTVSVVLGVLHYTDANAVLQFGVGIVALALLAWTVGVGTEVVGARFGPAATGVLQSTLGNLPELFIVVFALRAGEIVVARTTIIGSLLANALLVLGIAIIAGAFRAERGVMTFQRRLPNDTTMLLMLVTFIIAILSTSLSANDRASTHGAEISAVGAVLILLVYGTWLANYLRTSGDEPAIEEGHAPPIRFGVGVVVLGAAGVAAAFVSDWFVAVIDPAVTELGISKAFTGLVIVAIAGNAVENVVGVQLAWKRRYDLSVSVIKNSVAQIAAFLYPALVLISLLFGHHLTFAIPEAGLVLVVALVAAALAIWQITGDGEAAVYEGLALVATYAIVATLMWFE
jgi:Ca2+:H+ antiporter